MLSTTLARVAPALRTAALARSSYGLRMGVAPASALMSMRFSSIEERKQWVGLTMDQDATAKNARMQRPMSPHLTIYRFPMTAILSISFRITGVALTGAICAAGIGLIFEPLSFYVDAIQAMQINPALITATKFTLAFPFTYHSFNGIRHLVWDTAKGVDIPTMTTNGYVVVALSAASALALAMM